MSGQGQSLDNLLLDLDRLWTKSEANLDPTDLSALQDESVALDRRFVQWEDSRVTELKPTLVAHTRPCDYGPDIEVGHWPGRVDTYFDLSIAGVWNVFRGARLLLTVLIVKLADTRDANGSSADHILDAIDIVKDIIASIPYHLMSNIYVFLDEKGATNETRNTGKILGGLLLMHPLYVASRVPFLPNSMRDYLRKCLMWIGSNMGIGQATFLAKVRAARLLASVKRFHTLTFETQTPDVKREYLESGCMIIWSGFLTPRSL